MTEPRYVIWLAFKVGYLVREGARFPNPHHPYHLHTLSPHKLETRVAHRQGQSRICDPPGWGLVPIVTFTIGYIGICTFPFPVPLSGYKSKTGYEIPGRGDLWFNFAAIEIGVIT